MRKAVPALRAAAVLLAAALAVMAALEGAGWYVGRKVAAAYARAEAERNSALSPGETKGRIAALQKKLASFRPKGYYLIIDTAGNVLFLKKGDQVMRQAVVSTGSGTVLQDPGGPKKWVFDTPRGEYSVKSKATDPSWIKPDWAFIEEGEAIPTSYKDRVEEGVLGSYALGIGNGYFIHGTLYTRLLGRNVTHGCVRVGDKDLEHIFNVAPIGTKVYIF